jgi:hypothetical protein
MELQSGSTRFKLGDRVVPRLKFLPVRYLLIRDMVELGGN